MKQESASPANQRIYYTPQTLAQMWQCSTDVIYDLLRQGKLQGFKVGVGWRISEAAVLAYEQNPENQSPRPYPRSRQPAPPIMRVV